MKASKMRLAKSWDTGPSPAEENSERDERRPAPPSSGPDVGLIGTLAEHARRPREGAELNFDDVARRPSRALGHGYHHTKLHMLALVEPPANGLAPFLTDPSLLPKRPPCAARSS